MQATDASLKEAVIEVLNELPAKRIAEVLDFALFLKQRELGDLPMSQRVMVRTVSASHLRGLVGLVAWGGDALEDTERFFAEDE